MPLLVDPSQVPSHPSPNPVQTSAAPLRKNARAPERKPPTTQRPALKVQALRTWEEDDEEVTRQRKKKGSLSSTLIQVGVVGVLMAGGVAFYVHRGTVKKEIADRIKTAREVANPDNPADLNKALKEVEGVLADDAKAPEALALAADLETELWLTHRLPGAEEKARKYLAESNASGKDLADRYGAEALQLTADGKMAEAEELIDGLRKKGASSNKLWFGLAAAYEAEGNLTLENQAFNQAVEKAWKSPRDSSAYAEALIDQGELDKAIEYAKKGLANNPEHITSRLALAVAQTRRRDHVKDAADTVKDLLSRGDDLTPGMRVRTLVAAAEVALFAERPDDALGSANQALAIDPGSHTALWAKARAQAAKKQPAALKTFQEATAAHKSAAAIYFDGAEALQANGDTKGALSLLASYENAFKGVTVSTTDGRTVAWLSRDEPYWLERGAVLRAAGKTDEAMAAYDKAIAAGGINMAKAHYAKGALYLSKHEYDKAGAELQMVSPPDGSGHLAEAYLAMGDVFFAKKDYPNACQNFAFGLARMKGLQKPREKLNAVLNDVTKRLVAAHKPALAKQWVKEAKPIIQ